jgi:hypothetical protein
MAEKQKKNTKDQPKGTPAEIRSHRAKSAASLMFVRDPISKLPVVDDAIAITFDRSLANMVNRSLFALTEAVLRRALGAKFAPLPPAPRPAHTTFYKIEEDTSSVPTTSDQPNENNKRPHEEDAQQDEPNKKPALDTPVPNPALPFQPTAQLLQNFANRINMLINAPIAALIPFPGQSLPAPRYEDDPVPKTLEAINKSIKQNVQPVYTRPKQSFPEIVKQVILDSPNKRLTAAEIFEHIEAKHPCVRFFVLSCKQLNVAQLLCQRSRLVEEHRTKRLDRPRMLHQNTSRCRRARSRRLLGLRSQHSHLAQKGHGRQEGGSASCASSSAGFERSRATERESRSSDVSCSSFQTAISRLQRGSSRSGCSCSCSIPSKRTGRSTTA